MTKKTPVKGIAIEQGVAPDKKARTAVRKYKPRAVNPKTVEQKAYICEQIAVGRPLMELCREPGMPAWRTVYDWMRADAEFGAAFARARDDGADAIAEQTLAIVDEQPKRGPDGKIDPAWVAHQKLRAEHRLKLLAKWNPKKYGERLEVDNRVSVREVSDEQLLEKLSGLGIAVPSVMGEGDA